VRMIHLPDGHQHSAWLKRGRVAGAAE